MSELIIKYMITESERRAKEKWQRKNQDKAKYYSYKSQAKKYVRDYADEDDLIDLKNLIEEELRNI